jgi:hypothetical protein
MLRTSEHGEIQLNIATIGLVYIFVLLDLKPIN